MTIVAARILLVEDDPVVRTFLADNLTADGYDLLLAATCEDALRELEYKQPDLAVIDVRLPDGSGLELIRRVREADGDRLAAGPDAAARRARPAAPGSWTASAGSSGALTTMSSSPSPTVS